MQCIGTAYTLFILIYDQIYGATYEKSEIVLGMFWNVISSSLFSNDVTLWITETEIQLERNIEEFYILIGRNSGDVRK